MDTSRSLAFGSIYVLQTGGTIDKDYPRKHEGYDFEICGPAAAKIFSRASVSFAHSGGDSAPFSGIVRPPVILEEFMKKDSLDMTDSDREKIFSRCQEIISKEPGEMARIIITHGTDTMIETGKYVARRINASVAANKSSAIIVFTGSLLPERFKESDADFNLGLAMGAVQCLPRPGVFIAMGQLIPVEHAGRVIASGKFINLLNSEMRRQP